MLSISHLTAGYGQTPILQDIHFELSRGLTVLLGQNGSGKTTLFRAISGSISPFSGQILFDGTNLLTLSPKRRAALIAQVLGTHQTLSGITGQALAEMAFYHKSPLFFAPGKKEKEIVRKKASEMNADYLLDKLLDTMSAGERQTAELLAAVCQDTPILLLDEPTSALDFNRTHEFLTAAKTIGREKILLASLHDPALALSYADRVLLLKEGTIVGDFIPSQTAPEVMEKHLQLLYPRAQVLLIDDKLSVLSRSGTGKDTI